MNRIAVAIGAMKPMTSGHYNLIKSAVLDSLRSPGQPRADKTFIFISANDRLRGKEFPMYGDEAISVLRDIYFEAEDFLGFANEEDEIHFIIAITNKFAKANPGRANSIMQFSEAMDELLDAKNVNTNSSVDFIQNMRGAPSILMDIMDDPVYSMHTFSLYTGKDDIKKYSYLKKRYGNRFEFAGEGIERTGGGISGTETRELMRRFNSLSPEEKERLQQVFPEFMHGSIEDIVTRFRQRADKEGYENLLEGIKRGPKGTKEYSIYLDEIMNELQYIKNEYASRRKKNARYRKEASKIQDAYSEIRRLKRKNEREIEKTMLSEKLVRASIPFDDVEEKKVFNRDNVREFFDKNK